MKENEAFDEFVIALFGFLIVLIFALIFAGMSCNSTEDGQQYSRNSYIERERGIYEECLSYEYEKDFCLRLIGK